MNENKMNADDNEVEIDMGKLFQFYLKHWLSLVASGLALALAAFLVTFFFITPQYKSSVTVYVNNTKGYQDVTEVTNSSLATAQKLVNTYVNIIKSNTVLNEVIDKAELTNCTPKDLLDIMEVRQIEDTEMFRVTISHPDPEMAAHIANIIAEVAPKRIPNIVEGSSTKIIDYAVPAETPYTPSYPKNIILGGLLGGVLMGVFLTLRYLFDMRLQDEGDIAAYFNAPVLGSIPLLEKKEESKGWGAKKV